MSSIFYIFLEFFKIGNKTGIKSIKLLLEGNFGGVVMQIDRKSLEKLLTLNDRQLSLVIKKLAAESGIDPASLNINPNDIASVRRALSGATDADIKMITEQYENYKNNGGKGRK